MSVYLDSQWQPIEKCTTFLIRDTDISSDGMCFFSINHVFHGTVQKSKSIDCRTRSARKEAGREAGAPVSGLQSHSLRGSTVAQFEQKTSGLRACRLVVVRSMELVAV
jgi:hypothetical protein